MNLLIKRKFKNIICTLMALAMIITAMPFSGETVYADTPTPLTFTAKKANSTIVFNYDSGSNVKYRIGDGSWQNYANGTEIKLSNVSDKVSFKGNNITTSSSKHFTMTGEISASGDITSLINGVGGNVPLNDSCFESMFSNCDALIKAPNLPSTSLAKDCYFFMFSRCTSLTTAPALPATSLAEDCYRSMFSGCAKLTTAPALPATSLAKGCYRSMFCDCFILPTAPALPATSLAEDCYYSMFDDCYKLTTAPTLPATSLAKGCYANMFYGCSNLTTAPALPATSLAENCYYFMFNGCSNLTTAPALPATSLAEGCYYSMFSRCTRLTSAPALPATSLAKDCYANMFYECTGLTSASALPATSLAENCYFSMFNGCSSLASAPSLPATSLAKGCYTNMFYGCSKLTTTPALPATSLAKGCYASMFGSCNGLTTTPALPATSLAEDCYYYMFNGCINLTTVPDLPATSLADSCYEGMFNGCSSFIIFDSYSDTHQIPWAIPASARAANGWSDYMFESCGSQVCIDESNPIEIGRTYYLPGIGVSSLSIDKESLVLEKNQTANLSATVTPSNATYKNLIWTSSNESVATVDSQGNITAIALGSASITVKTERNEKTAVCNVTVMEHSHTYSNAWSMNAEYHWHQATCEHSSEVSDKAPHTWDGGRITTEATVSAEGVKTYTCTVCGQTKTVAIPKLDDTGAGNSAGGNGDSTGSASDSAGGTEGSASDAGDSFGGAGDSSDTAAVTSAQKKKNTFAINAGLKVSQTGSKIKISWGKVSMADGYTVSVAYCNTKLGKNKKNDIDIKGAKKTSTKITKVDGKKINLKENFKVVVKAYKYIGGKKQVIGTSIIAHVVGAKNKTYTNAKAIKLSKSKYTLKAGKEAKIKAKTILVDKTKKQLSDEHAKEFRYKSTNTNVAKVSANGVITAVKKGTCFIYVYSRNGYAKKITVTVK